MRDVQLVIEMKIFLLTLVCGLSLLAGAGCRGSSQPASTGDATGGGATDGVASSSSVKSSDEGARSGAAAFIAEGVKAFEDFRNEEAMAAYNRALEIDPQNGEAYYRLGLVYADTNREEEATKHFQQAVERLEKRVHEDEDDSDSYRYLALAHGRLGEHAEAVKAWKQVVRLEPEDSYNYYELGAALSKLAQYPEAVQALKKATQLDPDNYRAAEALDRAQEGVKRRDAALKRQEEELRQQSGARPSSTPLLPVLVKPQAPTPQPPPSPKP